LLINHYRLLFIKGDDGGIFKRTIPTSTAGKWLSLNGNIRIAECHSGDYDFQSKIAICGAQDQGTSAGVAGDKFYNIGTMDGGCVVSAQQTNPHKFYRTSQGMGYATGCTPSYDTASLFRSINITTVFPWNSAVSTFNYTWSPFSYL